MVFVSDRPGGLGGFGIYYSVFNGSTWGTPTNAGTRINTKDDEYRPVFLNNTREMFRYPLIVFSPNRPGGKGGFDLYLTGLINDSDVLWGKLANSRTIQPKWRSSVNSGDRHFH